MSLTLESYTILDAASRVQPLRLAENLAAKRITQAGNAYKRRISDQSQYSFYRFIVTQFNWTGLEAVSVFACFLPATPHGSCDRLRRYRERDAEDNSIADVSCRSETRPMRWW
jgi:hypothetical protein